MCFYPLFRVAVRYFCLKLKCAAALVQFILNINTEMRKRNGHPDDDSNIRGVLSLLRQILESGGSEFYCGT
jgi:hypothetical protein